MKLPYQLEHCYDDEMAKAKRHVIPIDFTPELKEKLQKQAEAEGLALAAYLRHLIITHPKSKKR